MLFRYMLGIISITILISLLGAAPPYCTLALWLMGIFWVTPLIKQGRSCLLVLGCNWMWVGLASWRAGNRQMWLAGQKGGLAAHGAARWPVSKPANGCPTVGGESWPSP